MLLTHNFTIKYTALLISVPKYNYYLDSTFSLKFPLITPFFYLIG